jgi:hypothetical protein
MDDMENIYSIDIYTPRYGVSIDVIYHIYGVAPIEMSLYPLPEMGMTTPSTHPLIFP